MPATTISNESPSLTHSEALNVDSRRTPRRPRIVFVHPAIRPYRAHIYQELQRRFDARFLVLGAPDLNRQWADSYGIRRIEILPVTSFPLYRSNVSWSVLRHAAFDDYDIWVGSILYAFSTHVAFPIVKARRKLFALWTEDWYWGGDRASRAAVPYCRSILRHLDVAIAAGSRQARFLRDQGVPEQKIAVATNSFVPIGQTSPCDSTNAASNRCEPFRVLYLGRLLDYKGPQVLIRAYAKLASIAAADTELLVCGQGAAEAECRRLVSDLGLTSVRFIGRVEPEGVAGVYRQADVFVHPCRWNPTARIKGEAWGFVVNEAMASGLPVITTSAVAAAEDLVREGETGFVVPPDNPDALFDRLAVLYRDRDKCREMGSAARRAIDARFRPEHQADSFSRALESLWALHQGSTIGGEPA